MSTTSKKPQFAQLLNDAVNKEGIISKAYSQFHNYSFTNQILAYIGCAERGIDVGPIATFKKWQSLGRQVKKGERAISLYLPVVLKEKDAEGKETGRTKQIFLLRPNWFALSQTEGEAYQAEVKSPEWNAEQALQNLGITVEKFSHVNGNCQGYAKPNDNVIAINPVAQFPHKTRIHEIAHVLLHKTEHDGLLVDNDQLPRDIKEVEAESVAYIIISLLNLPGQVESRGYIQNWLQSESIADKSAQRIFGAVEKILKAGKPVEA